MLALVERSVLGGELSLHGVIAGLGLTDRLGHGQGLQVLSVLRHVERQGATRLVGLKGLRDLLVVQAEALGDLGDRRGVAQVVAELRRRPR